MGTNGATPTSYSQIITAIGAVRQANFEPGALIEAARTATTFDGLVATDAQPLNPPPVITRLRRLWTTALPINLTQGTSNDTTESYVGDFSNLVIGVRAAISLRVLDQRYADTGEIALLLTARADIAVQRPTAFAVITGIRG